MNKIFKIVFNAARGKMMVVNEATSSVQTGKKAAVTVAVVGALAAGVANAALFEETNTTGSTLLVANQEQAQVITESNTYSLTVNKPTGGTYVSAKTVGQAFSEAKAGKASNTTFEKDVTISHVNNTERNVTGNAAAFGVDIYSGEVNFKGNTTVKVESTQTNGINVTGLRAWGYQDEDADINLQATLNVTGESLNITVKNANTQERDSDPKWKESQSSATGIELSQAGSIVVGKDTVVTVDVEATGIADAYGLDHSGGGISQFGAQFGGDATFTVAANKGNAYGVSMDTSGYTHTTGSYEGVAEATFDGDLTIDAKSTANTAYGIYAVNGSKVTANGDVTIDAEGNAATGMRVVGSNATLGGEGATVNVTATATGSEAFAQGIQLRDLSKVVVNGAEFNVSAQGAADGYGYGLTVQGNNTDPGSELVINAAKTNIEASSIGIWATGTKDPSVTINGESITIKAPTIVENRNNAKVHINPEGTAVVNLQGDINFSKQYAGLGDTGTVNVNMTTSDSVWEGGVKKAWSIAATEADYADAKLNVTLGAKGAKWINKDIETSGVLGTDAKGVGLMAVNSIAMSEGTLDLSASTQNVTVKGEVSGTGYLHVDTEKSGALVNTGTDSVDLLTITTVQTADELTAADAEGLKAKHTSGIKNVEVNIAEGLVQGALVVGANGKAEQAVNAKTEALAEQVALAPQMITRIMMNDVRKRMGDLRAAEGTHGVWARYNGGQMAGSGMEADFNMIQVGVDTVPVADAPRFGVAFSYAQTEAEATGGLATTDMDSFSLAFYGTKMYDNGMFVDVIGRMATTDTEMNVLGNKGKMDNVALSLSGELGWRFDVTDRFFFEPSVEATYTYTNADRFEMSKGGTYELEAVDSLVGRAGFAAGMKCPGGHGDLYVRAAVAHEFMGDSTMRSWSGTREAAPVVTDGKDTWFEYAIGANFNVNKNTYVYADVERTSGANVDEDWRANVGVRFAF